MAQSTGIVLTATALSFGNEWLQTGTPNLRIPIAGLGASFFVAGIERLDTRAGVGIAYIMLITALLTPFNGKSPAETAVQWTTGGTTVKQKGTH